MHEAAIIQEALATASARARECGCQRVLRVVLGVGSLSSAVPEALEFAFAALRTGTPADQAELTIERIAATAWCDRCRREFSVDDPILVCPECGTISGEIRRGFELDLLRVEAE